MRATLLELRVEKRISLAIHRMISQQAHIVEGVEACRVGSSFRQDRERELAQWLRLRGVVGDELLDNEHAHEVCRVLRRVYWNATVAEGKDLVDGILVQHSVGWKGVGIFETSENG